MGKNPLNSVCFSPDARFFFTCDTKGTVLKYDLKSSKCIVAGFDIDFDFGCLFIYLFVCFKKRL